MVNLLWVIIVALTVETVSIILKARLIIIAWRKDTKDNTDLDGYCFFSFPLTCLVEAMLIILLVREIIMMQWKLGEKYQVFYFKLFTFKTICDLILIRDTDGSGKARSQ